MKETTRMANIMRMVFTIMVLSRRQRLVSVPICYTGCLQGFVDLKIARNIFNTHKQQPNFFYEFGKFRESKFV
jgi:hypothetical protein